jgi:hypothetical protein
MSTIKKQSNSEKHETLVLATLDYLINYYTGEIVFDGLDPIKESYEFQKIKAESYSKQGNLGKLREQLDQLTQMIQGKADLKFTSYIKEKTGYDLDIYAELRKLGTDILSRGIIQNDTENWNVRNLLELYKKTNEAPEKEEILLRYLNDFSERKRLSKKHGEPHSRTLSSVVKDGVIVETIEVSIGPKLIHQENRTINSPDLEKSIFIYEWSNGRQASTGVNISFKTASGGIYQVEGIHPEIDAYWKDNHTVIIHTSKGYVVQIQHHQAQSFNDVLSIEYVEK